MLAVPIDVTQINMLYVFVEIAIDVQHLIQSIKANFDPSVCTWLFCLGS